MFCCTSSGSLRNARGVGNLESVVVGNVMKMSSSSFSLSWKNGLCASRLFTRCTYDDEKGLVAVDSHQLLVDALGYKVLVLLSVLCDKYENLK